LRLRDQDIGQSVAVAIGHREDARAEGEFEFVARRVHVLAVPTAVPVVDVRTREGAREGSVRHIPARDPES
jgi:hypothetical protein